MSVFINGVEAIIGAVVGGTWTLQSGTWIIPPVTVRGPDDVGGVALRVTNLSGAQKFTVNTYGALEDNGYVTWGGTGLFILAGTGFLNTENVNDTILGLRARDTGVGLVEIAAMVGAAEPRFGHTLPLNLRSVTALTIATGVVTIGTANAGAWFSLAGEGGAADDLDTINGGATGDRIVLKAVSSAVTITVKHATGNIQLDGQADFLLDNANDIIELIYDGTNWLEISRSSNGV